jgi:hypothetical protein
LLNQSKNGFEGLPHFCRRFSAATTDGIVACGFPNVALALSRGFQRWLGQPWRENQPSECRQADGGVSILDSLPRASGRPPDQVSTALNAERLRSACTVMGLFETGIERLVEVGLLVLSFGRLFGAHMVQEDSANGVILCK